MYETSKVLYIDWVLEFVSKSFLKEVVLLEYEMEFFRYLVKGYSITQSPN